jgi:hypothetical protein
MIATDHQFASIRKQVNSHHVPAPYARAAAVAIAFGTGVSNSRTGYFHIQRLTAGLLTTGVGDMRMRESRDETAAAAPRAFDRELDPSACRFRNPSRHPVTIAILHQYMVQRLAVSRTGLEAVLMFAVKTSTPPSPHYMYHVSFLCVAAMRTGALVPLCLLCGLMLATTIGAAAPEAPLQPASFEYDVPVSPLSPWPQVRRTSDNTGYSPVLARAPTPSGTKLWSYQTGKGLFTAPVIGPEDEVLVGSADKVPLPLPSLSSLLSQ